MPLSSGTLVDRRRQGLAKGTLEQCAGARGRPQAGAHNCMHIQLHAHTGSTASRRASRAADRCPAAVGSVAARAKSTVLSERDTTAASNAPSAAVSCTCGGTESFCKHGRQHASARRQQCVPHSGVLHMREHRVVLQARKAACKCAQAGVHARDSTTHTQHTHTHTHIHTSTYAHTNTHTAHRHTHALGRGGQLRTRAQVGVHPSDSLCG